MRKTKIESESKKELDKSKKIAEHLHYPPNPDSIYFSSYSFWRWFRFVLTFIVLVSAGLIGGLIVGFNVLMVLLYCLVAFPFWLASLFLPSSILTSLCQAEQGLGEERYIKMVNKKRKRMNILPDSTGSYQNHIFIDAPNLEEVYSQIKSTSTVENVISSKDNIPKVDDEDENDENTPEIEEDDVDDVETIEYQRIRAQSSAPIKKSKIKPEYIYILILLIESIVVGIGMKLRNLVLVIGGFLLVMITIYFSFERGKNFKKRQDKIINSKDSVTIKGIFTNLEFGSSGQNSDGEKYIVINYKVRLDGIPHLCRFSSTSLLKLKNDAYDFYYNPKYPKYCAFVPSPDAFSDASSALSRFRG